ncbi:MAG: RNA polymerase sigma factor [Oligoflexia bacterium]|nr:RNA polymerase sigma factor [Oligoflexia bacterium]
MPQNEPLNERELLARLKARDRAAWNQVLSEHGPRLVGFATRMLGDPGRAEDVVQNALLGVMQSIDRFEGRSSIKSWLFRAVHNRAIDDLRRASRYVELPQEDASASASASAFGANGRWLEPVAAWRLDERVDAHRMLAIVRDEIDALPHAHREILLLKETHQLDTAELAEALGITPGNARVRLHRARQALRTAVSKRMD